jgi:hypothetical protein
MFVQVRKSHSASQVLMINVNAGRNAKDVPLGTHLPGAYDADGSFSVQTDKVMLVDVLNAVEQLGFKLTKTVMSIDSRDRTVEVFWFHRD